VLGLKRNCTADDITRAYQELVLLYHPAKNPGFKMSEEKTKEVILNSYPHSLAPTKD
jgi:curved DNA-binding protein CbpA